MLRQLKAQGGMCPLCAQEIDVTKDREGVIDHDHSTGECRGVLHRSCNSAEGKIRHAVVCWGTKTSEYQAVVEFLDNLVNYLKQPGLGVIYAQHQTPEEKKQAAAAKRKRKTSMGMARRQLRKGSINYARSDQKEQQSSDSRSGTTRKSNCNSGDES